MASYEPVGTVTNTNDTGKTRTSYRARRAADAASYLAGSYAVAVAAVAAARTSYENSRGYCGYGGYCGCGCKRHCSRGTCKGSRDHSHDGLGDYVLAPLSLIRLGGLFLPALAFTGLFWL
jgi:hypothetical protein